MTETQLFERWAKRRGMKLDRVQIMTRDGARTEYVEPAQSAWKAWLASRKTKR